MSANSSPDEPKTTPETAADGNKPETSGAEDNRPHTNGAEPAEQAAGATAEQPAQPSPAEGAADPEARIAELEAQVADLTDRLLRAHAEMDNIRKRAEREKADMAKYGITKFAGDIVAMADNFQRAISAVPPEAAEQNPTLKAMIDGIEMTEREFLNVLERHGVKRIDPKGQPFNPHLHDAMMEQHNPDVPSGTVVQVFQPGYTIEDRVLRPAMVVVSKGGPKSQPAQQQAQEASGQPEQSSSASEGDGAAGPSEGPDTQ